MIHRELIDRLKSAQLWSKNIYFDMFVTKWAGLWAEDLNELIIIADQLCTEPSTAQEYRKWLKK